MAVVEFLYLPTRWAKLVVSDLVVQADVDSLFASVNTTNWALAPTWDVNTKQVMFQMLNSPFGQLVQLGAGSVIVVERQRFHGVALPPTSAEVVYYAPGEWSDANVTYL